MGGPQTTSCCEQGRFAVRGPRSQLHGPRQLVVNHPHHADTKERALIQQRCVWLRACSVSRTCTRWQPRGARDHGHGQSNYPELLCWFTDSY